MGSDLADGLVVLLRALGQRLFQRSLRVGLGFPDCRLTLLVRTRLQLIDLGVRDVGVATGFRDLFRDVILQPNECLFGLHRSGPSCGGLGWRAVGCLIVVC